MSPEELESEVRYLLELQGWNVSRERLLGHKKVDAVGTKSDDFGLPQTIAIEVKSGKSGCTRADISRIYADYLPLVEGRLVDSILLVTEGEIAPTGATYIAETTNLRHLRYADLLSRVIDFSQYVAGLRVQFTDSALASRYVPQNYVEGDGTLEEHILSWARSEHAQPIAILGGYGLGKSTLARRVASNLATNYERDPTGRIPVLVPLSYLATDQTLEGLLGRLFTTSATVHNYNYDLFLALNRRGKFLILLDGFDEMKRTMSWDSLRYNLSQLNLLVHKNSKVVLLGRPTAFVSEAEHNEALHGRRTVNRKERKLPDWPDYLELHISPFTRRQVEEYLNKVLKSLREDGNGESRPERQKLRRYLERIQGSSGRKLVELISRPVQLRMLVEILPEYEGDLSSLTVALLYEEFIDLVIRRELDKASRQSFDLSTRRKFAGKLAFWLWQDGQKREVDAEKIPDKFFAEFARSRDDDLMAVRRDLLSGCFLERKPPNSFYFPHRSFQEYLVAERLAAMTTAKAREIENCPYLTDEILSFFVELIGRKSVISWRRWIRSERPHLNAHAVELVQTTCAHFRVKSPFGGSEKKRSRKKSRERRERPWRLPLDDIVTTQAKGNKAERGKRRRARKGQSKTPHKLG